MCRKNHLKLPTNSDDDAAEKYAEDLKIPDGIPIVKISDDETASDVDGGDDATGEGGAYNDDDDSVADCNLAATKEHDRSANGSRCVIALTVMVDTKKDNITSSRMVFPKTSHQKRIEYA